MNCKKLIYETQREIAYYGKGDITGVGIIDAFLNDCIISRRTTRDKPEIIWVECEENQIDVIDGFDFGNIRTSTPIKTRRLNLETYADSIGNRIHFHFDEIDNKLYLKKASEFIDYITIFCFEFVQWHYKLIKELPSDNFRKFEAVAGSHKCILTIIDKQDIRHMYE